MIYAFKDEYHSDPGQVPIPRRITSTAEAGVPLYSFQIENTTSRVAIAGNFKMMYDNALSSHKGPQVLRL